jgi:hypothetical protein
MAPVSLSGSQPALSVPRSEDRTASKSNPAKKSLAKPTFWIVVGVLTLTSIGLAVAWRQPRSPGSEALSPPSGTRPTQPAQTVQPAVKPSQSLPPARKHDRRFDH